MATARMAGTVELDPGILVSSSLRDPSHHPLLALTSPPFPSRTAGARRHHHCPRAPANGSPPGGASAEEEVTAEPSPGLPRHATTPPSHRQQPSRPPVRFPAASVSSRLPHACVWRGGRRPVSEPPERAPAWAAWPRWPCRPGPPGALFLPFFFNFFSLTSTWKSPGPTQHPLQHGPFSFPPV
jgi:hypothetical protein